MNWMWEVSHNVFNAAAVTFSLFFSFGISHDHISLFSQYSLNKNIISSPCWWEEWKNQKKQNWAPQLDLAKTSFDQMECWLRVCVLHDMMYTTREKCWPDCISFHCILMFIQIQVPFSSYRFSDTFLASLVVCVVVVVSRKSLVKFA